MAADITVLDVDAVRDMPTFEDPQQFARGTVHVLVNGELATVWTPYDFYVGTEFSHCGIDVATVLNDGGTRRIVALSWTRLQPPACALHPEGPPAA